jgi:diguanylate cyclase (GGDEF)-like protein
LLAWLGLYFSFPLSRPNVWFPFVLFTLTSYLYFQFVKKQKIYPFEIFFSIALLIAGGIQLLGYNWLHIIYLLFLIPLTAFYPLSTIIPLSFSIPLLEIRHFMDTKNMAEEIAVNIAIVVATISTALIVGAFKKKKQSLESDIQSLKKDMIAAASAAPTDGGSSIMNDTAVAEILSSMANADDEITTVLVTIKKALLADSVNFFVPYNSSLKLRCSTENLHDIITSNEGLINVCFKDKHPVVKADLSEKSYETGYLKKSKIASFIGVPVIDEPFMCGVLSADTSRYSAFSDGDIATLQLFAKQLIRILQQERESAQIERSYKGLRMLQKEGAKFTTSLKLEVLAKKLVDSCNEIAPSSIIFMLKKGGLFEVIHCKGSIQIEKTTFKSQGTLLDMVKKNTEPYDLSDVRNYSLPLMPFKTKDVSSICFVPLIYEDEPMGMLVFLSNKVGAFNPYQKDLLSILGTQGSMAIANAKAHAEIEKMATTDGLTGLFNHRRFQERLSEEFKRLERFSEPLSLLLLDIDYFKKVNDTYGHPAGDKILQGVADILRNTIRDIDIPARYGGEEFAAILLNTEIIGAKNMAERLRQTTMDTVFKVDGKQLKITVSIGIANTSGPSGGKKDLIEKADRALYHAKETGRNRCVLWSEI